MRCFPAPLPPPGVFTPCTVHTGGAHRARDRCRPPPRCSIQVRAYHARHPPRPQPVVHLALCTARQIVFGTLGEVMGVDMGAPLHSLVVLGTLHELEVEFLQQFKVASE